MLTNDQAPRWLYIDNTSRKLQSSLPDLPAVEDQAMWDDEDNNPYASFHRRDSETSDIQSPDRASIWPP